MPQITLVSQLHCLTGRNYTERVVKYDKPACAEVAKQFGKDYWDGERKFGYGGYRYDGRWSPIAAALSERYQLCGQKKVLDVGCGKGFLLYELTQHNPQLSVTGLDPSVYALEHAKEEVKPFLQVGRAEALPFPDHSFDLVISVMTLHNLYLYDLKKAVEEIIRVSKKDAYICVESYRNEREKNNLLCWQLTCEAFFTPEEWEWLFAQWGYAGDYEFLYFE